MPTLPRVTNGSSRLGCRQHFTSTFATNRADRSRSTTCASELDVLTATQTLIAGEIPEAGTRSRPRRRQRTSLLNRGARCPRFSEGLRTPLGPTPGLTSGESKESWLVARSLPLLGYLAPRWMARRSTSVGTPPTHPALRSRKAKSGHSATAPRASGQDRSKPRVGAEARYMPSTSSVPCERHVVLALPSFESSPN